jgi:hypothetical protein
VTRVPYADRPEIRAAWCSCPVDDEGEVERYFIETRDEQGRLTSRTWYRHTNPDCRLHGTNAQPSPF